MPNCKGPSKKSNERETSGNSRLQNVVKRIVQRVVACHGRVDPAHGPKRFAFISYKGGSGKTTECVNTAAALAECGRKVLVIDCDAQGDASGILLKKRESEWRTVLDLFQDAPVPTRDVIQATHFKNVSIIPADAGLNRIEKTFDFENDPQVACLADAVAEVEDEFDYVLFDCAGAVHLTGYAAMAASDMVIIPVEPSQLSLRNIQLVNAAVQQLRQSLNPQVRVRYVLSKVAQQRQTKKMARIARRVLVQAFGRRAVLRTEIPLLPIFQSAINVSEPMVIHAKRSRAANITRQLARELTGIPRRRSHHFLPPIKWQRFSKAN